MKYPYLYYVYAGSQFIPILAGSLRWRAIRKNEVGSAFMFGFITLGALTELISYWLIDQGLHNLWILHFYIILEYVILIGLFLSWQRRRGDQDSERSPPFFLKPVFMKWSLPFYAILWLISKWTFEKLDGAPSFTLTVSSLVFIVLSLSMLYRLMRSGSSQNESIVRAFPFWSSIGILIYFAGGSIRFLLLQLLVNLPKETFMEIWSLHWIMNTFVNILFAIGFLCLDPKPAV